MPELAERFHSDPMKRWLLVAVIGLAGAGCSAGPATTSGPVATDRPQQTVIVQDATTAAEGTATPPTAPPGTIVCPSGVPTITGEWVGNTPRFTITNPFGYAIDIDVIAWVAVYPASKVLAPAVRIDASSSATVDGDERPAGGDAPSLRAGLLKWEWDDSTMNCPTPNS